MDNSSIPIYHKRLEGKVAIITGGASGIGAAAVKLFHENGAKVVIADIQDKQGQELASNLGGDKQNVSYVHCNITNEDDVINLVNKTVSKFGQLDIMYNNAGVIDNPFGTVLDTTRSDMERVLAVNTMGSFLGSKYAAKAMVERGKGGCILFTSSACTAIAGLGSFGYGISKYGVLGMVRIMAAELGRYGIRVNCVSPYAVMTGIGGLPAGIDMSIVERKMSQLGNLQGVVLKAEDVAKAALYLASDEASYVSGLNLVIDGGFNTVNPSFVNSFGGFNKLALSAYERISERGPLLALCLIKIGNVLMSEVNYKFVAVCVLAATVISYAGWLVM